MTDCSPWLLLIISLAAFVTCEMIKCKYARGVSDSEISKYRYTAILSTIAALYILAASGFDTTMSLFSMVCGVLFGVVIMGQIAASAAAMKIGPWAYTTVMMSLSAVIPALSGVLFWGEPLTVGKVAGIILMVICFVLSVKTDEEETKRKGSIKWLLLSLTASLCTGGMGILQKFHQNSMYKDELLNFLYIAFALSAVLSFVLMNRKKKQRNTERIQTFGKRTVATMFLVTGTGAAVNHVINLYLAGAMESAIFFPVMGGGELILVTVASVLVFREKMIRRQWAGLISGMIAVVILSL